MDLQDAGSNLRPPEGLRRHTLLGLELRSYLAVSSMWSWVVGSLVLGWDWGASNEVGHSLWHAQRHQAIGNKICRRGTVLPVVGLKVVKW